MSNNHTDGFKQRWQALPRSERAQLSKAVSRGSRGTTRPHAALMLWWAGEQLRRGPWPALGWGALLAVGIVVLELVVYRVPVGELLQGAPLLPLLVLIPPAAWTLRRPKLQQAAALNAALLAGHPIEGVPGAEEINRILAGARKERWFRATGS